ncbi:S-layer family protein [Sphingomonas koreensis]|uniref:S-layer family protein n=1 Tax=Sphingomonas koreensis TaxID=93064 RepID=UPI000F7F29CC|nr:S-layer family protein [Sphingomonas koreensis]RSU75665.1 S-layer family protein [Sphingomonas koreensis]
MKKLHRGRLLLSTCLTGIALASAAGAQAQDTDPNWQPRAEVDARASDGSSQVSFELFAPVAQNDSNLLFVSGRIGYDEHFDRNGSVTIGGRGKIGDDFAIGVNAGVDFYKSNLSKRDQTAVSFGLEGFTSVFDVRLNYRLPVTNRYTIGYLDPNASPVGALLVENNRLIERKSGWRLEDVPLGGANAEIGATIPVGRKLSVRASAAGFDYRDDAASKAYRGVRGALELGVEDPLGTGGRFTIGAELQNDNRWGTQARGTVRLSIPFGGRGRDRGAGTSGLDRQMGDRIRRDYVTPSGTRYTDLTSNSFAIDARTGNEFGGIYYVNGAAAAAGAGTSSSPTTLADAVTRAGANGVVVAMGNAGNITTGGVTLATNQYLVGGASSVSVRHSNGTVSAFSFGSSNGTVVGSNAGGAAVTLGQGSVVRDLTVRGAGAGILANGVGGFSLDRVTIENTGGAGLTLTNTTGTVVVDGITIRGGAGAGLLVNGGSGLVVRNSTIGGGAGAIDINDAGGNLTASLSNLTLTATGGTVLDIDGSGAGTVQIAGLSGIFIAGGYGETGGFAARNVTFDSSTATGIQAVNAGSMQVGSTTARVNGAGVSLTEVDGALSFASLNIANNAGTGLTVNNTKAGTFTLTSTTGTVDTTAGTALNLDPLLINLNFAAVSSTGAAGAGIILDNVQGAGTGGSALNIGTLTIANSGQQGLLITGGSTGLVTIGGGTITNSGGASVQIGEAGVAGSGGTIGLNLGATITDSGPGPLVSLFNTGGAIRFTGAVSGTGPIAIDGTAAGSSIVFAGNVAINGATGPALSINNVAGTVGFTGTVTITNPTGSGILIGNSAAGSTVAFTGATTITGAGAPALSLNNLAGATAFTGALSIINPAGTAIVIGAVPGGVTFGDVDITGLGAATGLDLTGTSGNVTFATLDITGTGAAGSTGIDLTNAANAGAVTIVNPSVIQGVDIGANLTNAHITGSFRYGDGNAADGLESRITANTVILVAGMNATQGTYDFADVQLDGNTNNITGGSFTTYYVLAGATGTGTALDPGSIAGAAASGAQYIVLLNNPNGGQDVIDTGGLAGGGLSLTAGQSLVSFLNTDFFAVTGATVPANLIVSNLGPTGIVNTFAGSGAAILTSSLGGSTVNLANDTRIDGVIINNDAFGIGVVGSGVSNVIVRNSTISGTGGAISITDGGAATSVTLANLNLSASGGTVLNLNGTGAGTVNVSGTGINIAATGTGQGLAINDVTVGTLDVASVTTGTAAGANGAVYLNQVAGGAVNVGSFTVGGASAGSGITVANSAAAVNIGAASVANTAGAGVAIQNNSGAVTIGPVSVANSGGAGLAVSGNTGAVTLGAVTISNSASHGVSLLNNAGALTLGAVTVANSTGDGVHLAGNGATSLGQLTLANIGGTGLFAQNVSGNLNVAGATITGATGGGVSVQGASASSAISIGALSVSGSGGTGIVLDDIDGTATFTGATTIAGSNGIRFGAGSSGTISFGDVDITGLGAGMTGVDARSASGTINVATLDISGISTAGTRGIDMTGASFAGNITVAESSTITGVGTGIDLTNAAITGSFRYGDGSNTDADGAASTINAITPITVTGINEAVGSYNFADVVLNGDTTGLVTNPVRLFFVEQGRTGAGTKTDPGSLAAALASNATVIVLLNNPTGGNDTLDVAGLGTFALDANQRLIGFLNGDSQTVGGGTPVNMLLYGLTPSVVTNPYAGSGAGLLTHTGGGITVTLANGASIDGIRIGGTGIGVSGVGVSNVSIANSIIAGGNGAILLRDGGAAASATLTNLSLSGTGGTVLDLLGTNGGSLTLRGSGISIAATGNARGLVMDRVTLGANLGFGAVATQTASGSGVALNNIGGSGGLSFTSINVGGTGAGAGVSLGGNSAAIDLGAVTVANAAGDGVEVLANTGNVTLGTFAISGAGGTGLRIEGMQGAFTALGGSITGGATGLSLTDIDGSAAFTGGVTITGPGGTGIRLGGGSAGTINFGDVDINALGGNSTGLDARNASGNVTFGTLDITGISTAGTRGIDLTGATFGGNLTIAGSSTITGVGVGVDLSNAAITGNFRFGDGSNTDANGAASTINATIPLVVTGLNSAVGTYNFADVNLVGDTSALATSATVYWVLAGASGAGTRSNPGSLSGAAASGADIIVLLNDPAGGNDLIDVNDPTYGTGGSFTLLTGQQLRGFLNGDSIALPGGAPANVVLYNVATGIVTNPFAGSGAPTLTSTTPGTDTVRVSSNVLIDGVRITSAGTGVYGTAAANVTIRNSIISGVDSAIELASGGGAATAALSNLVLTSTGASIPLALYVTGGGSMTVTQLSNITIDQGAGSQGAYLIGATFDADLATAGYQAVDASMTIGSAGSRLNGNAVDLTNALGALNFTALSIYNQNGTGILAAGSGLALTSTAGTIDTLNGTTISLTGTQADLVLDTVVHAGTGTGVAISGLTGIGTGGRALSVTNLQVTGGTNAILFTGNNNGMVSFGAASSISGTSGASIAISSGTGTLGFIYDGSVTQSANAALLDVTGHNGSITFGTGSSLSASNGIGLQFDNADGTYAFNGTTTLNGGDAGIDILNGSGGSFTFANASITSPTGIAISIADSTASLSYTGSVAQANNAALLSVLNHSGGTVAFQSGTLSATNGTGLQFDNADGTYAFNGTTTLNGGDAGIDILNGSGGGFTFANASITSPTGIAINIADSTASLSYTGSVTQANNAALLSVLNHSGGTVVFQSGTLSATNGTGLQFDNADGTYAFNGTTTLNGGDAGIDILNGSGGSFTFGTNATITDPSGPAFNIHNSIANVTYLGTLNQSIAAALALNVSAHSVGTLDFSGATLNVTSGLGLTFNDADGVYSFGNAALSGGAGIAITNGSAGTFTFGSGTSVTNAAGAAISIGNSTAGVTYSGVISQSTPGVAAVDVSAHSTGALNFTGATIAATGGTGLTFNNADGSYGFGAVALSGGARLSLLGGSAGAFTFGHVDITGLAANTTAVDLTGATGNVTFATLDIAAASAIGTRGIDMTGSTTAANVIVSGSSNMSGLGIGVDLTNAAITGNFRYGDGSNTDANGAASNINAVTPLVIAGLNGGTGNYNFADVNLNGDTTNLSVSAYFVLEGATGSGTRSDPGSLAGAEAANATYIVLLNDPLGGNDILDATAGAGGSFDLDGGQILYSFRDTDSFTVGGGAPANIILYNVQTGVISNPFAGSGAPTLTASGANATLTLGGNNILDGVIIANSGTGAGILGNGVGGTLTIRNSTISGGAAGALRIYDNAANVVLGLSNLTLAANGGNILHLDGTGAGTFTLTQLANLTVNHSTETGGFLFSDVTFDSDTLTAGLQAVNAGALTLGTTGARITGDGLSLTNVTGTLNFSDLNIANNGGTGLIVANSKVNNFTLGTTGGAIDTTNGTAINLDPLSINMVLNSVSATGGAYGILLDQVLGNFTVTGAVNVSGVTGAGISVRDNTALGVLFQGAVAINNTAGAGVLLTNNAGATVNFTGGLGIVTTTGTGFASTGGGTISVTGSGNTITTGNAAGFILSGITVAADGVTFDQITAAPTMGTAVGAVSVNLAGSLNIGGLNLDAANNAVVFSNLTGAGGVNLTGTLDIDSGVGFSFSGALGTINIANSAGSSLTIDGAQQAIRFLNVTGGTVNVASSAGSAAINGSVNSAIDLSGDTGGTLNYGGTINAAQGSVLNAANSLANVTLSGAITSTTAGTVFNFANADGNYTISGNVGHTGGAGVAIDAASAGGITFSGASKTFSTGNNAAITTAGTGTLSFSGGGLGITTITGTGFAASGGGTVQVDGAGNTITASSATALSLNGVTLASGGVNFQSINATTSVAAAVIADTVTLNGALSIGGLTVFGGGTAARFSNLTGGAGVNLTGTIDIDGSSGFEFTGTLGTINIADAAGSTLTIDSITPAILFNGVTSGTVNIGMGGGSAAISADSAAIRVDGGTGGLLNYGGTITQSAGGGALWVSNSSSLVTLTGAINSTSAGSLFTFNNADGTYSVTGAINHNGGTGVVVDAPSSGAVTFSGASKVFNSGTGPAISMAGSGTLSFTGGGLDIDTTTDTAFRATGGTVIVTGANNRIDTTTGQILNLSGVTAGTGGINFASLTATGTVTDNAILLSNLTGDAFSGGTVNIGGTSGAANDGIKVSTGTAAINFGATTIGAAGSNAIELLNSGSAVTFGTMNLSGGGGSTVVIDGSTGPVTLGLGTITATGAANHAVSVTGGTGNITVGSALSGTNMVRISDHETGTVTFSGNMASTVSGILVVGVNSGLVTFTGNTLALNATGAGVLLSGNAGGTIDFNPAAGGSGLDIVSSGAGFDAASGGTIIVRGAGNSISTTGTGMALNLQNVTIGANGFEFNSVSANGAAIGMMIHNVGTTGPALSLGTVNLQGITSRGIDISGNNPVGLAITDLDIALNSNSAVAFDLNGATLSAPIIIGDFDVTNAGAAGTSIAVDLQGTLGGASILLGGQSGASSSIAGVGTGIALNATTNALLTYGDGESVSDIASTISASTAIDATNAPLAGTYDFRDVAFAGSPGAGFGVNKIWFVDADGATGGGNGSGSDGNNPMTIAAAAAIAGVQDIIVLVNNGQLISTGASSLALATGAQLRGFGNGAGGGAGSGSAPIALTITVPSTILLSGGSTINIADPTGLGAATLTSSVGAPSVVTLAASGNRLSGFILDGVGGVARGIFDGGAGTANAQLDRLTIRNFVGVGGVVLAGLNSSTIDNVAFSGNALDVLINGGSGATFSNISSTGASNALSFGGVAGLTLTNISVTGAFGFGLQFTGTTGTVTATNVDITNTSGAAISVSGGTATYNFDATSSIAQGNNASALSVAGGHSGTLTYAGTIGATNGTGLQFDNADGTYNFTGTTTLNGGDAGIDILNGSGGSFTFGTGTSITSPTGAAFNVAGSTAAVTYSGSITQASNAALVNVLNHSGGTITFQTGTLVASNGTGLQFNNADGIYNFNGTSTLNGGDAGIDIVNGSVGTFGFGASTAITHAAAGDAFVLTDSNADVTYSGSITDSNGYAIRIDNHDAGAITFQTGNIGANGAGALGLSVINSNGGAVNFNGAIALNTGANTAITLDSNAGGTVSFSAAGDGLDIVTTSGTGLLISGGGTVNVLGANNSITSTSGTLLNVSNATAGATTLTLNFGAASNTSGANGILISRTAGTLTGSVNIAGGAITATNRGVDLDGDALTFAYGGSITTSGATARSVEVTNRTANLATFLGNITDNALGINIANNTGGTVSFSGPSIALSTVANATALTLANNTGTSILFGMAGGGNGLDILASGTGTGISFTGGGLLAIGGTGNTVQTATGQILNLVNGNVSAAGLTFDSLTSTGTVAATAINVSNVDGGTLNGGNVSIAGTSGVGSDGIFYGGGSTTNMNFGSTTITGTADEGIEINGAGNGTFAASSVTINDTGGNGVEINGATNSVTLSGGAIGATNDPTGFGVYVLNGTGAVNIASSINKTTVGNVVFVDNHETGNVTFSGNISGTGGVNNGIVVQNVNSGTIQFTGSTLLSTGANTAVSLLNNTGGTISFPNGGLSITTASGTGFNATGGGTVDVQGTNSTITSGTGTALNIVNTNIGSNGVNFRSISSSGAASGIILNNTGSAGGLRVVGTGAAGSGGTIQNSTGDGISLTGTENVRLAYMNVTNNLGDGIGGSNINGFVIDNLLISGNGTDSGTDESGINIAGLTGSASGGLRPTGIFNSTIQNNYEFEVQITNSGGTLTNFQIVNSTISYTGSNSASAHGNLVNFLGTGTSTMGLTVTGSTFTGNWNPSSPPVLTTGSGLFVDSSGTSMTANVSTSNFYNNNNGINMSTGPGSTTLTYSIIGNTITGSRSTAINDFHNGNSPFSRTVNGTIQNNIIGINGVALSGSQFGNGISVSNEGAVNANYLISGNTIQQIGQAGVSGSSAIAVNVGLVGQATGGGTTNLTILNNTIRDILNSRGIIVNNNQNTGTLPTVRLSLMGNQFLGTIAGQAGNGQYIRLSASGGGQFFLTQLAATGSAIANEVDDANGFNDASKISIGAGGPITYGSAAPTLPPAVVPLP